MEQPPIRVTEGAKAYLRVLCASRGQRDLFVRVRLERRGCAGFGYALEYVDAAKSDGETLVPVTEKIFFCVGEEDVPFLAGTEVDYDPVKNEVILRNPNEKGRCCCGASFRRE